MGDAPDDPVIARRKGRQTRWQVPLFRALRDGLVEEVEKIISENPRVLHEFVTEQMEDWELQWEAIQWYEMRKVTPLVIAAAYGRPDVVRWLLERGADPTMKCYHNMTALHMAGDYAPEERLEEVLRTKDLLKAPKRVPIAPNDTTYETKVATLKEVLVEVDADSAEGEVVRMQTGAETMRKKVAKRLDAKADLTLNWYTPWLPGGTPYNFRYKKLHVQPGADGAAPTQEISKSGWTSHHTHNTRFTIQDLPTGTGYVFQVRAQNDIGWGPFNTELLCSTAPHPAPEKAVPGQK
jgi:hypothetical protein